MRKSKSKPNSVLVDIKKLFTVANYAALNKETRQNVYVQINNGKLQTVSVDGVRFVQKK